jgi:toxin ParE1/3/4
MAIYKVSRKAIRDLDEIWYFIARDNETAATRQIDRVYLVFRTLATQPLMGRARPEIATRLRSFAVEELVIFYQPTDRGVRIVRVWDGRQNPARLVEAIRDAS